MQKTGFCLNRFGCHFGQGFYLSKPLLAEEISRMIRRSCAEQTNA
ncbi:hypothetical protein [Neptuniibacter halophilus]|nr:hypothetical protein [Neptuniibacter halophilus]